MLAGISLAKAVESICGLMEKEAENRSWEWPKINKKVLGYVARKDWKCHHEEVLKVNSLKRVLMERCLQAGEHQAEDPVQADYRGCVEVIRQRLRETRHIPSRPDAACQHSEGYSRAIAERDCMEGT
jgi:hypothetical protein